MSNNIRTILEAVNGASFITISTSTEPELLGGKKNPFKGITKKVMAGANVMVFQNKNTNGYEAMVQRRLAKEGKNPASFQLGPRAWGERIPNLPIVEHNGQHYLEVIFLSSGKVHFEVNGQPMDPNRIEGLKQDKEEGKQGGLNDKVIIRTFKLSSVTEMTVNKQKFVGPFTFE